MIFSVRQWGVLFAIDVLFKSLCVSFGFFAFMLSPVFPPNLLMITTPIGLSISTLNLLCLFLVSRLGSRFESGAGLPTAIVLILGNILFVLTGVGLSIAVEGSTALAGETAFLGVLLAIANVISVLIVVLFGCAAGRPQSS